MIDCRVMKKIFQKFAKDYWYLILSVVLVFVIKMLFARLPSFGFDMWTWFGWARKLAESGPANFYISPDWTQYTPGYLYYLWAIGKSGWVNEIAIKLPVILAEIGTGVLIYKIIGKRNRFLASISFFLYTLSPVVIFDGAVWGQIDGLLTFFLFLSAYLLIGKKNFITSILVWSLAFLIKPQSIAVLPVFILVILLREFKWKEIAIGISAGLVLLFLLSLPFFPQDPILGLPRLVLKMTNYYAYTSVNAFNIWSWWGMWASDKIKLLGLAYSVWGTIFLLGGSAAAVIVFRNKLKSKHFYYLLFAILCLCFFLFPTKVHERYLFPFFAFLLTAAGLSKSIGLFSIFGVATVGSFFNLYYPYSYYYPTQLRSDFLYNFSFGAAKIIGGIFLLIYFLLLFWSKLEKPTADLFRRFLTFIKSRKNPKVKISLPKLTLSSKTAKLFLGAILLFAFVSRVFDLGMIKNEYFDEVYHAFTARTILHGDSKAWEWWNTPPTGFAYEWTHPPLAKLGMVAGMLIFGENSFGWRIPGAILGLGVVFLVYLLSKTIFKDEGIGLLSAAVFSLDGLSLVMSRIGMNDSYLLFFVLLTIYLFLKQRDFWAALSFGLAISSKWSAIWVIPILAIIFLHRHPFKESPLKLVKTIICFSVLPFAIYLLSYLPMFLTGHTLAIWWEMQKQMWWYHTGLRATHPYTSSWWTWPLLIRPIYLYTSNEVGGVVGRIYAFGNPLIFWFGLASVTLSFVYSWVEKNKKLALIVFSYLIFFVPWAASPRIMFLYHYLPSIPFLAIATGYVLRRSPKLILAYLLICLFAYLYFYPHWIGVKIPVSLDQSYYWVPSWR